MQKETVLKINVLRGGTQGATVTFTKQELKSGINWENAIEKDFTWPVQGEFKKDMEFLGDLYCRAMEIKNKGFIGIEIELKPKGYVIKAQKLYYIQSSIYVGDFKSIPITPEHPMWEELQSHMLKLTGHLEEYGSTETRVDTRQMVLDLVADGTFKLPAELDGQDIENINDEDLLARFQIALEKKGMFVINPNEENPDIISERESDDDNFQKTIVDEQPVETARPEHKKLRRVATA